MFLYSREERASGEKWQIRVLNFCPDSHLCDVRVNFENMNKPSDKNSHSNWIKGENKIFTWCVLGAVRASHILHIFFVCWVFHFLLNEFRCFVVCFFFFVLSSSSSSDVYLFCWIWKFIIFISLKCSSFGVERIDEGFFDIFRNSNYVYLHTSLVHKRLSVWEIQYHIRAKNVIIIMAIKSGRIYSNNIWSRGRWNRTSHNENEKNKNALVA